MLSATSRSPVIGAVVALHPEPSQRDLMVRVYVPRPRQRHVARVGWAFVKVAGPLSVHLRQVQPDQPPLSPLLMEAISNYRWTLCDPRPTFEVSVAYPNVPEPSELST